MKTPKRISGYEVTCQPWVESDRGWGISDDGYSLHMSKEDIRSFVKEYTKGWPAETPAVYDRIDGSPYTILVNKKTLDEIQKSKFGIRRYGNRPKAGSLLKDQ